MKVKVKFRDTEFGLFEPSFTVPVLGTAERFRGIYLDFEANGVPQSQLVLDQSIRRYEMLEDTRDENPVFAKATDGVYWLIERILDSECEWDSECQCGEAIEIEYEGEDMEANNMAAMREAVGNALWCLNWMDENTDNQSIKDHLAKPIELLTSALATPARNCDVGTAEEQAARLRQYCLDKDSLDCRHYCMQSPRAFDCSMEWAQLPYEERGNHA